MDDFKASLRGGLFFVCRASRADNAEVAPLFLLNQNPRTELGFRQRQTIHTKQDEALFLSGKTYARAFLQCTNGALGRFCRHVEKNQREQLCKAGERAYIRGASACSDCVPAGKSLCAESDASMSKGHGDVQVLGKSSNQFRANPACALCPHSCFMLSVIFKEIGRAAIYRC
jgi:hypothetical protein